VQGKDLVQLLKKLRVDARPCSRVPLRPQQRGKPVSVQVHAAKELGKGLLHALLKEAGLK